MTPFELVEPVTLKDAIGLLANGEPDVRAVAGGATLVCIGHPLITQDDPLAALTEYVRQVKANYRARP